MGCSGSSPAAPQKVASSTATQLFQERSGGHKGILHDGPCSFSPMHVAGCHPISIFVSDPGFRSGEEGEREQGSGQDLGSIKVFFTG